MKLVLLLLAAIAAALPSHADATDGGGAQAVLKYDLFACMLPVWPAAALAQRANGTTTLEVRISQEGYLIEGRVTGTSGRRDLDEAALDSMRGCSYRAVLSTGEAPTGWLKTQYRWTHTGAATSTASAPDGSPLADTTARASSGDPAAQNLLGTWYQHGTHVKADLAQAAIWYERAAQGGNAWAQNNLGVQYWRGAGVRRNPALATQWYAKAAEQGHRWAQANLAWSYQHGLGNETDMTAALYWLTEAAEGGLAAAQVRLGTLAMRSAVSDDERAAAAVWLARAAAQDDPSGLYLLGRSYALGLGNAQDDDQAAALYRKALGRSEGRAETALGALLDDGRAAPLDRDESVRLYERGMQARHAPAFYRYGLILEQRGDEALAAAVFRHGANMRDCDAVLKYLQLRPEELIHRPNISHPPRLIHEQQRCRAQADLPPQL